MNNIFFIIIFTGSAIYCTATVSCTMILMRICQFVLLVKFFAFAMISLEFLIDVYVTVRLYKSLRKANKDVAQESSNM